MNQNQFPGEVLQSKRIELGLTVDDVYRKLRVPSTCVRAFESGKLDDLPAMTYAAGFLKTYCEFLGFDPEPWTDRLRSAELPEGGFRRAAARNPAAQPPWLREIITWAGVCALLALGWLTYAVVVQPTADHDAGKVQAEMLDKADEPELQAPLP